MPSPNENLNSTFMCTWTVYVRGVFQSTSNQGLVTSLKRYRFTSSVVTPNFKRLRWKGYGLPNNPYTKNVVVTSDPQMTWHGTYKEKAPSTYYGESFWQLNASAIAGATVNVANADDPAGRAIARMLSSLNETKVNTLVTAAEMRKTTDHIAKTATRLYEAYRSIKKGDFRGLTTSLGITNATQKQKTRFNKRYNRAKSSDSSSQDRSQSNMSTFVAETWLEYSYAWKPLLFDVYGHAQAIAETTVERLNVIRYAKGKAKTSSKKTIELRSEATNLTGASHFIKRESDDKRWVEFGVAYRLQGGELNTFSQFGIDNPLEVLWELVPFSFVADWFLPIGDYLKSLTATTGLIYYSGYKSERRIVENVCTVTPLATFTSGSGAISTYDGPPLIQSHTDLAISRHWMADFPLPITPEFRNPFGNGADYGLTKALSAVALLKSVGLNRPGPKNNLRI